jgi:leucyl-tRNA synthetase
MAKPYTMKYNPNEVESKWQQYWAENQTFKARQPSATNQKPKYYVLDMFPYPSGAGLHVGHPLGYIASDIYARYKRHKGFNVLHPQGYDSFGLPAEQYAIQTGQHPDKTTKENIARYREQLDRIGFSFDWSREVRTSDPEYYKHTQWIFIQLFNSWYNKTADKAEDIATLIAIFEKEGNATVNAVCDEHSTSFTANEWNAFSKEVQEKILLHYRLTYLAETEVNWCPGLGTVLANDEIVNGVSERGGFPVIRKKMTQWSMRISAYAERLLEGLNDIDWTESLKESQRNWIGKSVGAEIYFPILTFPKGEGNQTGKEYGYMTWGNYSHLLLEKAKEMRDNPTDAEKIVWSHLKSKGLEHKFRQQHLIDDFIVDFVCLSKKLIIEIDGGYHNVPEQMVIDEARTTILTEKGYHILRFTNEEVISNIDTVLSKIKQELDTRKDYKDIYKEYKESYAATSPSPLERAGVRIFTTRPDTIFGVTFMTLAPEHELVSKITTPEQKAVVDAYVDATTKRSERERMADVKTISGVFTGAYAEHPFTKEPIPVWIGDYVLAGYGTGAVMAVPCGDERDYAFAHFFKGQNGMPEIKNIFVPLTPKGGTITESSGTELMEEGAFTAKQGFVFKNSDFLNGLGYKEATQKVIAELEKIGQGKGKINYRLRDAVFSRQRYWGEPFPVYYVNGLPQMIDKQYLPIRLPEVEKYLPTEDGQPPLGNAKEWHWLIDENGNGKIVSKDVFESSPFGGGGGLELNTMPGWAGSSWYWLRYMDARNEEEFVSKEAEAYWQNVDLYIGGSEHATGHLLYSRFWNKFLKDRGFISQEEPFKKLINQGMILGMSAFVYRLNISDYINGLGNVLAEESFSQEEINIIKGFIESYKNNIFVSKNLLSNKLFPDANFVNGETNIYSSFPLLQKAIIKRFPYLEKLIKGMSLVINKIHVDVSIVNSSDELDLNAFKNNLLYSEHKNVIFLSEENNKFIVSREVEKMSKSKYNVVTPDDICNEYGADTLRLYEMFLGPLEQAKPWNTAGISGVFGFLKKLWRLYFNDNGFIVTNNPASKEALKALHKTIKKVQEDIEGFSFNTSVSQFMICVNELTAIQCHEREILEPLAVLISPYAPHIAEELWSQLGHTGSIAEVPFPEFNAAHLVESSKEYPVSFNGRMRFTIHLPLDLTAAQIEEMVMKDERTIKQLDGKTPNKVIIVPGKIINLVG